MALTFGAIAVAAVVIVAAVFLLATRAPSGPPAPTQPTVILSGYQAGDTSGVVQVTSASAAVAPNYYEVGLMANGTTMMGPSAMPSTNGGSVQFTMSMGMSSMVFTVTWMDRGSMGSLDAGDMFYVNRSTSMMGCIVMSMDFRLMWWNDAMVAHAPFSWTCPPKPVVTFSSVSVTSTNATFTIAGATPVVSITSYKFNLQVNGVAATTAVALAAGTNSITVNSITYTVVYTDVSGNGNLKTGDTIRVYKAGGLTTGSYSFLLVWAADGSSYPAVTWAV